MILEQLIKLRALMADKQIDACLIPTSDFHESEYVGDYFKCRHYITGFTGSAGTAVVTAREACLWTDGRYFVQAEKELKDTGVTLFKMGQEGVPTTKEYLESTLKEGELLAFDGRVINGQMGESLTESLADKKISVVYDVDLIGQIWENRPSLCCQPAYLLDVKYVGKPAAEKIKELRQNMEDAKATAHIITCLDDIAWLLNMRGNDVAYNPVVLSYVVVKMEELYLFVQQDALNKEVADTLTADGITIKPYAEIYQFAANLKEETILIEKAKVNYRIYSSLTAANRIINKMNPTSLAKAVKNTVEIQNMKNAHIKDGVAVTKFMYWLKQNIGIVPMTEIIASDYLEALRRQQEGFVELSFDTISAYKDNAAMCHYKATEESNKKLEAQGLFLVDSGGQYYEGTTDITRTFALGPITEEEKLHYTLVASSMLNLGAAKFLYGCRGINLDYIARAPFWERGLNFDHGTGHGVGYMLNVHERPNGFRWKIVSDRQDSCVLEEGMVTSDEPGLYIEGSHGVRTENLIVCKKAEKNQYGQFMEFEYLTFAPIDLDAVDTQYMSEKEISLLNQYHRQVYDKISPFLTEEEVNWLREYTREVAKVNKQ